MVKGVEVEGECRCFMICPLPMNFMDNGRANHDGMNSDYATLKHADSCRTDDVETQQRDIQNLLYSRRLKREKESRV